MNLIRFVIKHYRSIEEATIDFGKNTPVILFGANNAGKSNVLKAIDCLLGEKYTPYVEFLDSDYFFRDKEKYPQISFSAYFDGNIRDDYPSSNSIHFSTNHQFYHYKDKAQENLLTESTFHYEDGQQMFLKPKDREKCQLVLIDATRDISRQLSYFSKYSILSRMAKKMHDVVTAEAKEKLEDYFNNLKETFESVPEYSDFRKRLQDTFESNIDGFQHKLEIDLSAYDPNNLFHSLRIIAKEGENVRAFDEFGTGEQQILLMSFVKAYAETFTGESFVLGIEEPEAHLHPLAQRWLSKNITNISKGSVQVILTTHSPEFLDIKNLSGFVKVYKNDGITKIIQHSAKSLSMSCMLLKSNEEKTSEDSILEFYKTKTFYDQLRGFFARKLILVEGPTELFSLPNYFKNCGYDLIKNGVEIINCRGKNQITRNYRLFKSYDYECFCLFDADSNNGDKPNDDFANTFNFDKDGMDLSDDTCVIDIENSYGYFGKDYETYLRKNLANYTDKESEINEDKVLRAKIISETESEYKPGFIEGIAKALNINAQKIDNEEKLEETSLADEDVPF